ncbi:MAG: tRNA (guanosine(46)-N7)-methyltransferase TrmB [Flavobacteriales bacterium]|jgi:tRNA (guanine-N7-)-methyltransferase|nr:MAG: tRNA (guanosine(46)-N7)-methyltransferase TrmB [Flavobacteriales bacterium]
MGKNKLARFAENLTFEHVVQPAFEELVQGSFPLKGRWNADFFQREAPLVLELGCGRGEYTLGLARLNPERCYIGVDIKGARIWRGARNAREEGLSNVGFLRTHVDHVTRCFGPQEVDEVWLTFSDPQLGKPRKRLTSPIFLARYKEILKPGGLVHLKTDSPVLYEYTLEMIEEQGLRIHEHSADIYADLMHRASPEEQAVLGIRTYYESMWLEEGRTIHYVRFSLD